MKFVNMLSFHHNMKFGKKTEFQPCKVVIKDIDNNFETVALLEPSLKSPNSSDLLVFTIQNNII